MRNIYIYAVWLAALAMLAGCSLPALHKAACDGDTKLVAQLLDAGANVNELHAYSASTPLALAAEGNHAETIKLLIDRGADPNAKAGWKTSPIYRFAWKSDCSLENMKPETARLLIDRGADVNLLSDYGHSPLYVAAIRSRNDIVKLLIEKGADLDYAIFKLEEVAATSKDTVFKSAASYLKRLQPKTIAQQQPASTGGLSKDDLKTIVRAAVEESKNQPSKQDTKAAAVRSDISTPSFASHQTILGDNDLAIVIGIEGYQNIPKSDYSYDDAKLVGEYAKALGIKPRNLELLLDDRATKSAIEKTIRTWLPNKIRPDSKVLIYYSGHGAPEPKAGDAYIVPFDGDPNYLSDTGIPLKGLYDNLARLKAAEVMVVLDACFSGAGGRSVLAKGARSLVRVEKTQNLPQHIAVLTATQGAQISTSSPDKGHGIFTYYFLKALKEGKRTLADIYDYARPLVEDEAKALNVQQTPAITPDPENLRGRFALRK